MMIKAASSVGHRLHARGALVGLAAGMMMLCAGAPSMARETAPASVNAAPVSVGANLNISPKRLTFDRSGKSATVYIFNQGTAPATFDIGLVDRVMSPSGEIVALSEAATRPELSGPASRVKSAQSMLLATPRRATLEPGKGQTIRVRVNPGAETTRGAGEYRTHLTVTTIPPREIGLTADEASKPSSDQLRFTVVSVFGISIPVIVRLGPAEVRAAIENPHITYADISPDGVAPAVRTAVASFDVARLGASSLFGNFEVRAKGGKEPIGLARGVGVYTEIDRRAVQIPLTRAPAPGEQLEITFTDDDTSPGRVLAQSAFSASQ